MRKQLLIIICFLFYLNRAFSQNSPVQVITTVMPPYSTLLSEYYSGDLPRLSVMLLNKDFNEPFMQVYLRLTIEGQGVKMQSSPYGNYQAIDLTPGVPVTASQSDLAPYFSAQNLQVNSGLSGGVKPQTRLPEGYYQFCFEAIEKNTNRVVGNKQCAQAFLTLSDPPFLTMPEKGKAITSANPFNLLFQWTPRHMGNPNAYNTEYEFTLVEIWDDGIAPEAAFYTAQPVYSTKLSTPNLFYGPGEPQLITGKKYAWRVKAIVTGANGEQEPFKNDGYSEIYWFKLQGDCPLIQQAQITINPKTNKADFSWLTDPAQVGSYHLDYRKKGDSKWNTIEAQTNKTSLSGLKWDTDYEYRMGCRCVITDDYTYGNNQSFRTLKQDTASCSPSAPKAITNKNPIANLMATDTIYASGFRMRLTKVSGSNGLFSGEGYLAMLVPTTTTEVSVKARFTNIRVNTDKQLYEGRIVSIYDATERGIANVDNTTEGGTGVGSVKTGGTSVTAKVDKVIDATKMATITFAVDSKGDTIYSVTMTGTDGKPVTIKSTKIPATVQDKNGDLYAIDKMGNVTKTGSQGASQGQLLAGKGTEELNKLQSEKGTVTFEAHPEALYAFDGYNKVYDKSILFSLEYEGLKDGKYRVANKLLLTNSSDKVIARVSNIARDINPDSIRYVTAKGVEFIGKKTAEGTYEITLPSGPAGDAQELYAVYRDNKAAKANKDPNINLQTFTYSLGKLKVVTYEPKAVKVVLVPVGSATVDKEQVSAQLDRIYKPIGVTWTVSTAEAFSNTDWDTDKDGALNITGAGRYNQYSDEMKQINAAYLQNAQIDAEAAYLFVFDKSAKAGSDEKGRAVMGDMLRNKQFGYIFTPGNTDIGLTAAHELAHGVFHLNHTFDTQYKLKEGDLPTNLMDYSKGDQVVKLQWDAIHSPGWVIGAFDKEGDAAYETDGHYSTVYLVCLMLGMSDVKARELAVSAEDPDTDVHSETEFKLDQTWSNGDDQESIHSLTGGFHGIEEFLTAVNFLYTPKSDIKRLGELLHRFGDTYAHAELDNVKPADLNAYNLNENPENEILAIKSWKGKGGEVLSKKIEPWITYFNYYMKKDGLSFLSDIGIQKKALHGKTLSETLRDIYLIQPSDKYLMYGGEKTFGVTGDHAFSDGAYPDLIYIRPEWYLTYVKNLAWLVSRKYSLSSSNFDITIFEKMVNFAQVNSCSLKGIIDYEIAKKRGKQVVYIPVLYSSPIRGAASYDAVRNSDYYEIAKTAVKFARKYVVADGKVDVTDQPEKDWNVKWNSSTGFFNTTAFKISFK